MKPVLAAAICLMLGSSSFSSRGAAQSIHQVQPVVTHPATAHRVVLAGNTVPALTGLRTALALVIVK